MTGFLSTAKNAHAQFLMTGDREHCKPTRLSTFLAQMGHGATLNALHWLHESGLSCSAPCWGQAKSAIRWAMAIKDKADRLDRGMHLTQITELKTIPDTAMLSEAALAESWSTPDEDDGRENF